MSYLYFQNFFNSGSSSQLLQLQKGMHRKEDLWPTELTKRQEDQAMKIDRSPRRLDSKSRRQVRPPPHHTAQLLVVSHLSLHLHVTHTRVPVPGRSITLVKPRSHGLQCGKLSFKMGEGALSPQDLHNMGAPRKEVFRCPPQPCLRE